MWDDVNARLRGLATHFPTRPALENLAGFDTLSHVADGLAAYGVVRTGPASADVAGVERTVRRWAARQFEVLIRWSGSRVRRLAIIIEEEDRRSIRTLVRGAEAGIDQRTRLAGLIPTPALGQRQLEELARCRTAGEIAAFLTAWRNPYGAALADAARGPRPDLLAMEMAVTRVFFERSRHAARHCDAHLRDYVRDRIDEANVWSALALQERESADANSLFLEGGRLSRERFLEALAGNTPARELAAAMGDGTSELGMALRQMGDTRERLEQRLLSLRIRTMERTSLIHPLSSALVILFALRLQAAVADVCRIVWGVTIGADKTLLINQLVTA
jgi:vacuolar-type H+-ATPase subunit C/Vma6